ncbi:MAG: Nif3-like dinuclear metal center hexameric protein [Bacteroidota bacterium]
MGPWFEPRWAHQTTPKPAGFFFTRQVLEEATGIKLREFTAFLDEAFPPRWAESWDNTGLTVGDPDASITRVLLSLDVTPAVVEEAVEQGCQMLLTHHPFPWRETRRFCMKDPDAALLEKIMRQGLNLFAVHTNLDASPRGHAARIGRQMGLIGMTPLKPSGSRLAKVVVYVPESHAERVRKAMALAGAGVFGQYEGCSFSAPGIGRFTPGREAKPFIGATNLESAVPETRIEVTCPESAWQKVVNAARAEHPYEMMVYDVWPLSLPEPEVGIGRIGRLTAPASAGQIAARLAASGLGPLSVLGAPESIVETGAVCPGSAGGCIEAAVEMGADLLFGAEISHHEALVAASNGLTLIVGTHYGTELPAIAALEEACADFARSHGLLLVQARNGYDPFRRGYAAT